ncbi:MAG: CHAT domain-containing protein [Phaeodactylibacter sp.]|nr:CHAT domain-containing protein [Phaeodactylibacter sp.]
MEPVLFLAFANSRENPLETLEEEYSSINKILAPRVLRQHFLAWPLSHATLDDISYYLSLFRERLSLFLFSGHAGRDVLLAEQQAARAEGISHLLGQCPRLKAVILNGCSTAGQVRALHQAGIPLVIATSAPVNDETAAKFSIRLFEALEAGDNIGQAFEQGIGEALARTDIKVYRSAEFEEGSDAGAPTWGIFPNPEKPDVSDWKLPVEAVKPAGYDFEENELLLETLYEALATNPKIAELREAEALLEERKEEIVAALLKSLPAPISDHIRKLVMPSAPGALTGWDIAGPMRLEQISQAFQVAMDFLLFTMLSQLWEYALDDESHFNLLPEHAEGLRHFLTLDKESRAHLDHFALFRILWDALEHNGKEPFVREFRQLRNQFLENEEVKSACFFLENVRRLFETAGSMEMKELCFRAEESLSCIFAQLGFMGRYTLATVRNIDVQKYRHTAQAMFEHLVVKWHGTLGYYDKEHRRQPSFMDNRSVILLRNGGSKESAFLNLSPFVIDENTFEPVPDMSISKLYFFGWQDPKSGHLWYRYVSKPNKELICLQDPKFYNRKHKVFKFELAIQQFKAFQDSIFHTASTAS